jgi:hypothetical protein
MMITVDDLVDFLELLPDDAGMIAWELTHFTVPSGQPPPWPDTPLSELPAGGP